MRSPEPGIDTIRCQASRPGRVAVVCCRNMNLVLGAPPSPHRPVANLEEPDPMISTDEEWGSETHRHLRLRGGVSWSHNGELRLYTP